MYLQTYTLHRNEKFQLEKYTVENFHLTITFLMNLIKLNFGNDILLEIKSILHRRTSDCSGTEFIICEQQYYYYDII